MRGFVTKKGTKWYAVVYLGIDDLTGKKQYKWHSGFETKKTAEKFLSEKVSEVNRGNYTEETKETVSQFLVKWLEYKKSRVRPRTHDIYRRTLNYHVLDAIGRVELNKLKPLHLHKLYTDLEGKISNQYIMQIHTIIHDALKTAVKWELINRNVSESIDPPRPVKFRGSTWSMDEAQKFLEASKEHRFYITFLLALTTGMRQGELLALRWSDVDFENRLIKITRSLNQTPSGIEFGDPKTENAKRIVVISEEIIEALLEHKKEQDKQKDLMKAAYLDQDLITARMDGNIITQSTIRKTFVKLIQSSGVPEIRFHDMRHTNATLLLQQGTQTKIVSERLGHANIGITSDIYQHVLPEMQKQAADTLGKALLSNENSTLPE